MDDLSARVAVVTGAASGIGLALARRFAADGMNVVMSDVEERALNVAAAMVAAAGTQVLAVQTDVSDPVQVDDLAARVEERLGKVHVLCNNAGVSLSGPLWKHGLADWQWVLGVNLWGVINGIRAFVPGMIRHGEPGHVVNTSSVAGGAVAYPNLGIYGATKSAVLTLSESLSMDLRIAEAQIGVSVLLPSGVNTRLGESSRNRPPTSGPSFTDTSFSAKTADMMRGGADPDDVANRVVAAIKDGTFYIYTNDIAQTLIRDRFDNWLRNQQPAPPATSPLRLDNPS